MKSTTVLLICLCCLMAALPAASGQAANSQTRPGILGYLDPQTGAFRPAVPAVVDDAELATATAVTGTITVTITITVKTTGLTNFTCSINVETTDNVSVSPTSYEESESIAATGTGSTRTCKLSLPYSWSLATPANDVMTTSYTVLGTTTTTGGQPTRISSRGPLDTRKVPANGGTTTLTAAVTQ